MHKGRFEKNHGTILQTTSGHIEVLKANHFHLELYFDFLQFFSGSFSLFSLVSFPNEECATTMTTLTTGAPVRWVSSTLFLVFAVKLAKWISVNVSSEKWESFEK